MPGKPSAGSSLRALRQALQQASRHAHLCPTCEEGCWRLNLVDACAKGYADSISIKKSPKEARTLFPVSGFEVGQNDQRGVIGLTVKFGMGGHLSFALDDAMANSLFEMLGVATGRVIHTRETPSN